MDKWIHSFFHNFRLTIAAESKTLIMVIRCSYVQGLCKIIYLFFVPEIFPNKRHDENKVTEISKTIHKNF